MLYNQPDKNDKEYIDHIDMGRDVGSSTQRHWELSVYIKELTDVSTSSGPIDIIENGT